jgi:uncharacterized repeat protein (TIGR03803 family)
MTRYKQTGVEPANADGSKTRTVAGPRASARLVTALLGAVFLLPAGAVQTARAQTFTVLNTFTGANGANPQAGLIRDSKGNLYSTTPSGYTGAGIVFKLAPSSSGYTESLLYGFMGADDGGNPIAGLVQDSSGNLYGTTVRGGSSGDGTVFKLAPSSSGYTESVLYSFTGGSDGAYPDASLILDAAGSLYGTTPNGGSSGNGTVFKLAPSSSGYTESVLYSFSGGSDGAYPYASLILDAAGSLYGTTTRGGASQDGVVFKLSPPTTASSTGYTESVLHSFAGSDGTFPHAGLTMDSAGNLYGTTVLGGSATYGTVFKLNTSGANFSVLHMFTGGSDGENPNGGLVLDSSNNLYGTTTSGGSAASGTVFKLAAPSNSSTGYTETILHAFNGSSDGANPAGSLIMDSSNDLYGTTTSGGGALGDGTAFELTQTVPFSTFTAKLDITSGPPPGFQFKGELTLGAGAPAVDPTTQGLTLTVGTYSVTVPASAFQQTKKGWYVYEGTINGVALQMRLSQTGSNTYQLQAQGSGVDLSSLSDPVTVSLTLGNNGGTTQVNASF